MKKLLFIVLLFISVQSFSQFPTVGKIQFPTSNGIGFRGVGGDSLVWLPSDTIRPNSSLSSRTHIAIVNGVSYYWNGSLWSALSGGGGGGTGNTNSNVGSAYRLAIPNTNNIKTIGANYGIILDSATTNQIGVKFDSATVFPQVRSTITQRFGVSGEDQSSVGLGARYNSLSGYNMTLDSLGEFGVYSYTGSYFSQHFQRSDRVYDQVKTDGTNTYISRTMQAGSYNVLGSWDTHLGGSDGNLILQEEGASDSLTAGFELYGGGNFTYASVFAGSKGTDTSGTVRAKAEKLNTYYSYFLMNKNGGIDLKTKKRVANTYKGLSIDIDHQVTIDSMASGGVAADSVVVITSGGQLKKRNASAFSGGGSTSPAGNYGNLQINRNGSFDTPASDSLGYTASGGLNVKNVITANAGTATRSVVTVDGIQTLTNKRWTARVGSTTSSGTPTINTDNYDIYKLTAQAANITSMTSGLSGTPVDGDILEVQITGTGSFTLAWGSSFVSSTVTLPTAITTTTLTVILQYYTTSSYGNNKWVCVNYY